MAIGRGFYVLSSGPCCYSLEIKVSQFFFSDVKSCKELYEVFKLVWFIYKVEK